MRFIPISRVSLISLCSFFSQIDRLFDPTYRPTHQDISHCESRTTGIVETVFKFKTRDLHLFDVAGLKSERRKWIHYFEDVANILFVVPLDGYDISLTEDRDAV
jgi:guanine nucleotide-binding protein subunit alpha, other